MLAEPFCCWDWDGVDVRKEWLWRASVERPDSVQARIARRFVDAEYDVVFDDDGPGEAAGPGSIKSSDDTIRSICSLSIVSSVSVLVTAIEI